MKGMSRAFVKETDFAAELPERPISRNRNYVTRTGLAQIDAEISRLNAEQLVAERDDDALSLARIARDLRYWTQRRTAAELIEPGCNDAAVRFGSTVTIMWKNGREQTYRIVGEDEADPAHGTLSYVSPLARSLLGKAPGDAVALAGSEGKIVGIA